MGDGPTRPSFFRLRMIEAHGGQVVRGKFQVGEVGFAASFRDPDGNTVGLWQESGR